jgi:ATP-dependent Clp protease ATP-binding subunit ClpC
MSEFQSPGSVDRLIGTFETDPPKWLRAVRRHPFCVVLFDEIEKAAPEVFDLFLALFDEGRLSDRYGRITWFRSSVIVMTTNLGVRTSASAGFRPDSSTDYKKAIRGFFRPELINRIDHIVAFEPLTTVTALALVAKELSALAEREGLKRRRLKVQADLSLVAHLAEVGFDDRLGARPLQRIIENLVTAPLAHHLLEHAALDETLLQLFWRDGRLDIVDGNTSWETSQS